VAVWCGLPFAQTAKLCAKQVRLVKRLTFKTYGVLLAREFLQRRALMDLFDRGERRAALRASVTAAAVIASPGHLSKVLRVHDLSVCGALLEGTSPLPLAHPVEVVFRVGSHYAEVVARAVRRGRDAEGRPVIGFAFSDVSADTSARLSELIERGRTNARPDANVLLVGTPTSQLTEIANVLRAAGCQVERAATPLEGITRLQQPRQAVHLVVVGSALSSCSGSEFAEFFREAFPEVECVLASSGSDDNPIFTGPGGSLAPDGFSMASAGA
jgi:hypothetical protein